MKTIKSVCCVLLTVLFFASVFIVNVPAAIAEGEVPGQVTNLRVTDTYPSAIHFEWDPVEGASYYRVIPYNEGEPNDMDEIISTGCGYWFWTWDFYGPNPSVEIEVRAVNEYGEGEASESRIGTATDAPEVMREITGFEVLSTQSGPNEENLSDTITFGYNFPLDTLYFYMEYSTNPDMSDSVIIELEPGVGCGGSTYSEFVYTEHTFNRFSPETTYYFQAHSRYYYSHYDPMDGTEDIYIETVSDIISCTTNDPVSAPQSSCLSWSFMDAGASYIDVRVDTMMSWEDCSGIKVYYSTSSDELLNEACAAVSQPIIADETLYIHIDGLDSTTTYYMQVVGYNSLGEGTPSEIDSFTTAEGETPGQVQNVQATPYPCAVYLTWDSVEGATSYKIPGMDDIITETNSAWVHGFYPECLCEFQVIACNSTGEGVPSEMLTVETLPFSEYPPYPSKVSNVEILETASGDLYSTAKINFELVTDAMKYSMKLSTSPDMSNARYEDVSYTDVYLSGDNICAFERDFFAPETTYYMQIVASNFVNVEMDTIYWDTLSDIVSFTTPVPKYPVLEQTTAEFRYEYFEFGPDSVKLAWSLLNDASGTEWGNVSMFRLFYSESPTGINEENCQYINVPVSAWVLETYILTELNPSTTYYLKLLPYNSLGYGTLSDIVSVTTTEPEGIQTEAGTNVNISDSVTGTSLSFDNVTSSGLTTVEQLTSPPGNTYFYFEESCGYYDIETTASFSGSVIVTLPYDPELITGPESELRLYQFKDGEPIDITISVDTENNTITGIVTDHFCAFAIGIPMQCTVTFNSNGGSLVDSFAANYNTTITAPDEPTKAGYVFTGWYKDEECTVIWNFTLDKATEDITLYAKWLYDFSGFFQPVDMDGVVNVAKAGSSIPIKFSLGGDMGLDVFEDGYPKVYNYYVFSGQTEDYIETVTFSNSGLTYDPVSNQYTYVWKTDKEWSGTCKQLFVKFRDGTVKVIYFKFK